ncbi:MAG: endonuclease/exonuclease/phosphatase family protein [Verrucomicrobia bacterium]|nr:endonuclease/exonuclease/phosphatase family protein [Verrucomicrobiota bacterium]
MNIKYRIPLIVSIIAGCMCCAAEELHILNYNIHHGRGMDDQINLPRIAEVILETQAHVVALQEVDRRTERNHGVDTLHELSRLTGMAYIFGSNIPYQGGEYGNAFLSRLPVTAWKNHHFRMLREGEQRGVLEIVVRTPDGRSLKLWNTHLDYRPDPEERLFCIQQLDELAVDHPPGHPLIIMGDFNTLPGRETYVAATRLWSDAWVVVRGQDPGFTFSSTDPNRRIDFQFIHQAPDSFKPVAARVPSTLASDHLPLLLTYEWVK